MNTHKTSEESRQTTTDGHPSTTRGTGDNRPAGLSRRALLAGAGAAGAGLAAASAGVLPGIRPAAARAAVTGTAAPGHPLPPGRPTTGPAGPCSRVKLPGTRHGEGGHERGTG